MKYHNDIRTWLDQVLLRVSRPARYVGGEFNMVRKEPEAENTTVCLAFPDIYDIGQSYIGFYILYNILNKRRNTQCERTFAPWTDMEEIMREASVPLWSLESFRPVSSFDVLGFTLQYELHYTTVLNMLDLAGIPLQADERGDNDPLVFGGGPCCVNPEPVADYFDAILLGDGEEAFPEMLDVVEQGKESGLSRRDILRELAGVDGVYVPMLYRPKYDNDGSFTGINVDGGTPVTVTARYVEALKPEYYPDKPLVPLCEVVHDRLAVELMRGCTRGCRFCNAGMTYRPKRERPVEDVVSQIVTSIHNTGWDEIGLVSLSTSDYSGLENLVERIGEELKGKTVSVSLSSLRADNFSVAIADSVAGGRKSSLTFAPEAGTQRLRDVINKNITEEQLFETLTTAFSGGWKSFKLYFMVGLPTETDEDIIAIADLLNRIHGLLRRFKGRRVNVTISSFSPKPQTPFQWECQDTGEEIGRKIRLLKRNLKGKSIVIKTDDPVISMLECRLGRGDRRLGTVIFDAWQNGCRLDGWSEHFNAETWRAAFENAGIALDDGSGEIAADSVLPWDHLSFNVEKPFLLKERGKAVNGECTPDCSDVCQGCGPYAPFCASLKKSALQQAAVVDKTPKSVAHEQMYGRRNRAIPGKGGKAFLSDTKFRIKFAKTSAVRYMGHLDLVRQIDRAMRRAGIPIAYSQGFHPHPKISFGPPLALGMKSLAEYADFTLRVPFPDIENVLRSELSHGLDLIGIRSISDKAESLNTIVAFSEYHVPAVIDEKLMDTVKQIFEQDTIPLERYTKKGPKTVDIRPGIISIDTEPGDTGLIMLLSSAAGKTVKPSEIINLLFNGTIPDGVTRTEQYTEIIGRRITPFEVVW